MDDQEVRTLTDRLDGISTQLEEVLALLRANMKKPPKPSSGGPMIHEWPDGETLEQWQREEQ